MVLIKSSADLYTEYETRMRKIADVKNAAAVLQWDQETYLPSKGAAFRGQQMATLSEIAHEWMTDAGLGDLLHTLRQRNDLPEDQQKNISLSLEDYDKQTRFTPAFVRQLSEASSRSFHSWIKARSANSFALFEPDLAALLELKKQEADLAGYEHHPYNALIDQYEKGATVTLLDHTFDQVRPRLKELLDRIREKPSPDDSFLRGDYPKQQQWDFGMEIIRSLGFDFEAGRQDLSEHPFTTSFNPRDVRITTRVDARDFSHMTWSCIHETGHALYEQGLPEQYYGLPLGEFASLSIHESQSRLWENNVGRSAGWWQHWFPILQKAFPEPLKGVTATRFYKGINKVTPSLIRTEADEVTYHFHVMIRYELEKNLIDGSLPVSGIPSWWKDRYAQYLGVSVPDDRQGCLQDVHWSHGSFGYFPTYSLGSFYAAQLLATATSRQQGLQEEISQGNTSRLLDWLRKEVHRHGRRYTSEELCQHITGETLNIQYFLDYLWGKYNNIYEI